VCFIRKTDFEKAYDSVSWRFLDCMIKTFMLDEKQREWMGTCVFGGFVGFSEWESNR